MATQSEAVSRIGEFIKWEEDARFSREVFVIKSGAVLVDGELCHADTGEKDALAIADAAAADSIYTGPDITGDGTKTGVFIVRDAVVSKQRLNYGALSGTEATADAALKALGILVRSEPAKQTTQTT